MCMHTGICYDIPVPCDLYINIESQQVPRKAYRLGAGPQSQANHHVIGYPETDVLTVYF